MHFRYISANIHI